MSSFLTLYSVASAALAAGGRTP